MVLLLGLFLRWYNITNFTFSLFQVFPYGSVPLKTYLPDGDIDLTALSCQNIEDGLVSDVHSVLRGEENNEAAEYEVKDVRFIDAEVLSISFLDALYETEYNLVCETFVAHRLEITSYEPENVEPALQYLLLFGGKV